MSLQLKSCLINIKTQSMKSALYLTDKELQGAAVSEESGSPADLLTAQGSVLPDSFHCEIQAKLHFYLRD